MQLGVLKSSLMVQIKKGSEFSIRRDKQQVKVLSGLIYELFFAGDVTVSKKKSIECVKWGVRLEILGHRITLFSAAEPKVQQNLNQFPIFPLF